MITKSILQSDTNCWVCGSPYTVVHHVFYGGHRKTADRYGLTVCLCGKHHNGSDEGVHFNKTLDLALKQFAQMKFEEKYSHEEFMKLFKRNYL